ncbi:Thioredoxin-like 4A [Tilletia horrida]|uniref:Thioredoxin-like 4A n=1 Tax=Tilletia horrida TaxID=155126 RepID=A0AAN6JS04_9BASI|nr:Thioredoxin-like 4A [Tilletia horrida]KAK0566029.1 Thioredoxin-like 4A [Tilletia horrida]
MATPSFRIKLRLPPREDGDASVVTTSSAQDDTLNNVDMSSQIASDDEGEDEDMDEGPNDDELDELVDEVDDQDSSPAKAGSSRSAPKKKKSNSRLTQPGSAPDSPSSTTANDTDNLTSKKRIITTREETKGMSIEELDALPAAKRRRAHQARGASGPGRGWRRGLKMGQKPVYHPPPEKPKQERSSTPKVPPSKSKAAPAPKEKPPAEPAGPRPKPFRYPVAAPFKTVTMIKPYVRVPLIIPTIAPLDRTGEAAQKAPRRWTQRKREIMSLGGRPWSVPTWFGGEDQGYPLAAERAAAAGTSAGNNNAATADGRDTPGGGGTPAPTTPAPATNPATTVLPTPSGETPNEPPAPAPTTKGSSTKSSVKRISLSGSMAAVARSKEKATPGNAGGSAVGGSGSAKSSPLSNTIPLPSSSAQPVGDWRGSSPAFFAGARKSQTQNPSQSQ